VSRRILFLVAGDYEALRQKGVDWLILERDEGGFFDRVVTVHPLARQEAVVDLNATHRIYEFWAGNRAHEPTFGSVLRVIFFVPRAVLRLRRIIKTERIQLIRATDAYVMGLLAWAASRICRIPFCVSIHADYPKRFALTSSPTQQLRHGLAAWIPRFVLCRAALVMPIREHLVPWVRSVGVAAARIAVIPHGIDTQLFKAPPHVDAHRVFGIPDGSKVVSFVGRMSRENYIGDVIDVVERVSRRRRDIVFVLVGDGPEAAVVRTSIDAAGASESTRMFPFQPHENVVALRRISLGSLCLMGGYSLIEACAAGSVPISYDVEWHGELVRPGETGYLLREHDVDGVVAALEQLADDPAAAARLGETARRLAFDRHDLAAASHIKQEHYRSLLGSAVHA
jgi:glycosyltransferase involved in cell wall biosynthesis